MKNCSAILCLMLLYANTTFGQIAVTDLRVDKARPRARSRQELFWRGCEGTQTLYCWNSNASMPHG